ncbi:MAG: yfgF [Moraxellaceae bacterium]|nr:yfgF [Moraxellaceae bacterium]
MEAQTRQPGIGALALIAVATALALTASRLVSVSGDASLIWPPLGIAYGLMLAWGWRGPLAVCAGLTLWVLVTGQSLLLLPVACLEVSAGALLATWLQRRLQRAGERSLAATTRFYFAGALVGGALSALVGAASFHFAGLHAEVPFGQLLLVFWVAEAMGVLVFGGLAFSLARDGFAALRPDADLARRWLLLFAGVFGLFWLTHASLEGVALPLMGLLVVWPAMRAQPAFLNFSVLLVTAAMLASVLAGDGPITNRDLLELVLQIAGFTVLAQLLNAVSLERRRMLERERESARSDLLTGLANDRALREQLAAVADAALLVVRVEDMTGLADLLGAVAAEEAEIILARELRERYPEAMVARLDRGRYAVFPVAASLERAQAEAESLYAAWEGRVFQGDAERAALRPTVAVLMSRDRDAGRVLLAADLALAVAVAHTGERIEIAVDTADLMQARRDLLRRQEEVKEALAERRFLLYAQPIVPVAPPASGEGLHCEILLRLRQVDGTIQAPFYFFPAAERALLTGAIDRYVIRELLQWLAAHPEATRRLGKCAINLTGWSVSDPTLAGWIREQVSLHGIPAAKLCFEITESQAIASREVAGRLVESLREMGSSVSLDDFGTGLATFDYLKSFPFDYLKIDGAFVRTLLDSPVDQAVVQSITSVARTMGLLTIAEFVENDRILEALRGYGVDYVQGYGVGKPVPLTELFSS